MDGVRRDCGACGIEFAICRSCWRRQVYCSRQCRAESRRQKHRIAEAKYSKTDKGRRSHRARQKRYRNKDESLVTDQTAKEREAPLEPPGHGKCSVCGVGLELVFEFSDLGRQGSIRAIAIKEEIYAGSGDTS
jgi:hypothetical protein